MVAEPSSAPGDLISEDDVFSILEEQEQIMSSTGGRLATTALESPSSVWVIDRQTIEASAALDVTDLLRRIPGIVPLQYVTGHTEIAVRGMAIESFSHILVLIDGRSLASDFANAVDIHEIPIALQDLERVEVIIGPASTTYGTGAYSAVINFITRDPAKTGWRMRANVHGGFGQAGLAGPLKPINGLDAPQPLGGGYLEYTQAFGGLRFRASANGDYLSPAALQPADIRIANGVPLPLERLSGSLELQYDVNHWSLKAQAFGGYKKSDYLFAIQSDPGISEWSDYSLNLVAKKTHLLGAGDELTLGMWIRHFNNNWFDPVFGLGALNFTTVATAGESLLQYVTPEFYRNRLVAGVQARIGGFTVPGLVGGASPDGIVGVFAEDQFRPVQPLLLTAGVRVETRQMQSVVTTDKFNAAPRGAIVYLPAPGHSLRLEVATAYRLPSPFEQLTDGAVGTVQVVLPNPKLKAEENLVGTLSYEGTLGLFTAHAEVFLGYRSNVIALTPPVIGNLPFMFRNVDDTESWGGSLQVSANLNRWVDLWAYYSFNQEKAINAVAPDAALNGHYPSFLPPHMGGIGGSFVWQRLTLAVQVYVSSPTPDFAWQDANQIYAPVQGRVIINPFIKYAIDEARRFQVTLAGTNIADIRFGAGAITDANNPKIERIGPRVWLAFDVALDKAVK